MRDWLSIGLLTGAMLFGGVGGVRAQTLEDALVAAYLTNPDLEAQRAALRATDELVPQALGGWRPDARARWRRCVHNNFDSSAGNGDFTTLSSSLTLDQEVYSGGETVASTERAERLVRLERARLQAIEQDVLLDAVTRLHQPAGGAGGARFREPERDPAAPPAAGDPGSLRGRRGDAHRRCPGRRPAVGRDRRPGAGRGRRRCRASRISPRDQSGARQPGRAATVARAARQRARSAAAGRGRQP